MKKFVTLLLATMFVFTACAKPKDGGAVYERFSFDEKAVAETSVESFSNRKVETGFDKEGRTIRERTYRREDVLTEETQYQYFDDGSVIKRIIDNPAANVRGEEFVLISADKLTVDRYYYKHNSKENTYTFDHQYKIKYDSNGNNIEEVFIGTDNNISKSVFIRNTDSALEKVLHYNNDILLAETVYNNDNTITRTSYEDGKVKSTEITYRNEMGQTVKVETYDGDGNLISP